MRLSAMRVIVTNRHLPTYEQNGIVQQTAFHTERGFRAAVRFGDKIIVLDGSDFKIHPDDVKRMDAEIQKEREFFLSTLEE